MSTSLLLSVIFVIGYIAIAFEHTLKVNKGAAAVLTGFLIWTMLSTTGDADFAHKLLHHMEDISSILFFLIGAMSIVEMIDAHEGFRVITDRIKITNKVKLYWIIGGLSFFLSAVLDNLTTAIVMSALLNKFVKKKDDKWMLAGIVIIAANAGGAWSPIGDVTTIMLWVGSQLSTMNVITKLILPSIVCLMVPLTILSFISRGHIEQNKFDDVDINGDETHLAKWEKYSVFGIGIFGLLSVPIFKYYTHLPPFMGVMGALGFLWIFTEILHNRHPRWQARKKMTVSSILGKIDHSSVLFFLGILLAVAGLSEGGILLRVGNLLDQGVGNVYVVNGIIGALSAIVDNVPLVAGAMGMYPLDVYPQDHIFWELLALCAGTGGSMLIIGSAAGVAVMGILHIDFVWYAKRIGLLALAGYISAIVTFWLMNQL